MIKIDDSLLVELGLGNLPPAEKNSLLKHVYETLEMRVGMRLADQMSNQQLDEFEQYFEAKDDAGAFKWLETNFPNYKDIVQEEFDKLKAEVGQSAAQILAASQAAAQAPATQMVPPAAPQMSPQALQSPPADQMPPQGVPQAPLPTAAPGYPPQAAPPPAQPYADPQAAPQFPQTSPSQPPAGPSQTWPPQPAA